MSMNAKEELLEKLRNNNKTLKDIIAISISCLNDNYDMISSINKSSLNEEDLKLLDFNYDDGYGWQELYGVVLFSDNTWLSRRECDGSEWWEYMKAPTIEEILKEAQNV